ncbi:DNA polymerase IV [Actinoplanes sp. NPDC023801]|uniref:DNA polymerase IV n=1 Tax=Actinoplanes sp. NPDC023801 TaxID=3154595 RepID=UPI0033CD3752
MRREPSILHVDLDAMFAAVEQRDKVSLRGKPVIVGGVAGRGVVATASYEARAYGAHSAMPTAQARRLCPPNTAFLSPRFPAYQKTSKVVMKLLAEVSPLVEQVSIDEAYIDLAVTGHDLSLAGITELAGRLKAEIAVATGGVTGSIGAASSKLLAKIGSDLNKPDGLTIVPAGAELDILHPLPVRRLGGVGPATEQRLHRAGVRTVGQLAAVPLDDLVDWFGTAHGHGLFRLARAEDNRPVVSEREAKSVSAEETFDVDLTDNPRLNRELDLLAARVAGRLRRSGLTGRTVNIKVRHPDFTTVTRAITRDQPTDDGRLIAQLARRLLAEVDTSGGVRLLGVGVSTLADFAQDDLFTAAGEDPPVLSFPFPEEEETPSGETFPARSPNAAVPRLAEPSPAGAASPPGSSPAGAASPPRPSSAGGASPPESSSAGPPPVPPSSAFPTAGVLPAPAVSSAVPAPPSVQAADPGDPGPRASPLLEPSVILPPVPAVVPVGPSAPVADSLGASVSPAASLGSSEQAGHPGSAAASAGHPGSAAASASHPGSAVGAGRPPAQTAPSPRDSAQAAVSVGQSVPGIVPTWRPGQDVRHDDYGPGWVRGSGVGRVTVRFEGPHTPPGPVRTFFIDDPRLQPADPPDWLIPVTTTPS